MKEQTINLQGPILVLTDKKEIARALKGEDLVGFVEDVLGHMLKERKNLKHGITDESEYPAIDRIGKEIIAIMERRGIDLTDLNYPK